MEAFILSTALILVDFGQTREIATNPAYIETNVFLGPNPSTKAVNLWFSGALVANAAIGFSLPEKYRNYWWYTVSAVELGFTTNNARIGISMKW